MKHVHCLLLGILLFYGSFAQEVSSVSASFLNDVLKFTVQNMEKKNENIVHAETGIFTINRQTISDYTSRLLHAGNTYTIEIFTDIKITDFKLLVWKKSDARVWERYDSINENNKARVGIASIGDRETIHITPADDREYAFQLISEANSNKTGRYAVIIEAESAGAKNAGTGTGSTGTTSSGTTSSGTTSSGTASGGNSSGSGAATANTLETYLSCDYYSYVYYKKDANDKWVLDGDWVKVDESSLYVVNPAETTFSMTNPKGKATYFVQTKKNDGKTYTYEVVSDEGGNFTFEVNMTENRLDIVGKTDKGRWYVIRRHLKKVWTK